MSTPERYGACSFSDVLVDWGRYAEADKLLRDALRAQRRTLGDTHPHTLESLNNLIQLYEAW